MSPNDKVNQYVSAVVLQKRLGKIPAIIKTKQKKLKSPTLTNTWKTRHENDIVAWEAQQAAIKEELAIRGDERMSELLCRVTAPTTNDKWIGEDDLYQHGRENGLPDDLMEVRPVRWEPDVIGLYTTRAGVQKYHRKEVEWANKTFRLPKAKMDNLERWAELLDTYAAAGPNRRDGPTPKASLQSLFSLLSEVDPLLVSDALRPLVQMAKANRSGDEDDD